MIPTLYEPFRHWSDGGSVYILSDLHFDDEDCKFMSPDWITPEEQLSIINGIVMKNDTFICLGDIGRPEYITYQSNVSRILDKSSYINQWTAELAKLGLFQKDLKKM